MIYHLILTTLFRSTVGEWDALLAPPTLGGANPLLVGEHVLISACNDL